MNGTSNEDKVVLTIAIPTYNRNNILKQNLLGLLMQLTNQIRIVVYDNFSDFPVAQTLCKEIQKYPNLKIIRNKANVGLSGNIIKCIEECDSKWVWLLSDDETPLDNAVTTVLKYINLYPDTNNINFKSKYTIQREDDTLIKGQNELIEGIDNINNFFLISLNIYNVEKIKPNLRFMYIFSYTIVPHFVLLIISLSESNTVILANETLVISDNTYEELDQRWSAIPLCMGLPLLFELPINVTKKNRQKLTQLIMPIIGRPLNSLVRVASLYNKKENIDIWKYNFEQPYLRLSQKLPFLWQLELWLGKIIFMFPLLLLLFGILVKKIKIILNRKTTAPVTNRFNRV